MEEVIKKLIEIRKELYIRFGVEDPETTTEHIPQDVIDAITAISEAITHLIDFNTSN